MGPRVTTIADLVLAGTGSACLLALAYFLYSYNWTGEREFTDGMGPFVYYLLPASLSALFFGSLRLRPAIKARLALMTLSTALSLCAVEIVLDATRGGEGERTLWAATTKQELERLVSLAQRYGVRYDTRSQLQVVRDSRSRGLDAVPSVFPTEFFVERPDGSRRSQITINETEIVVLGGLSNRSTVFCNESGEWVSYNSDEHGFHNPRGLWSSERLDVAVLGDSFAQGICVPSDRNFVSVIRNRYPATLNLGIAGMGPLMELAALKEYAARFRPKLVLWFLYEENDFFGLKIESESPLLMHYLGRDFSQGLLDAQAGIDTALEDYVERRLRMGPASLPDDDRAAIRLPSFVRLRTLRERLRLVRGAAAMGNRVDYRIVTPETMDLLAQILSDAKNTVSTWGGVICLVYLPERERYADPHVARLDEANRVEVLRVASSLGLRVIDMHLAFHAHGDPLSLFPFRRRGHYNEEGHRLVGEAVIRSLLAAK